jgi:hypothetical protein
MLWWRWSDDDDDDDDDGDGDGDGDDGDGAEHERGHMLRPPSTLSIEYTLRDLALHKRIMWLPTKIPGEDSRRGFLGSATKILERRFLGSAWRRF